MLLILIKKDLLLAKRSLLYTICEIFLTLFVFGICGSAIYYQSISTSKTPVADRMVPAKEFDPNLLLQRGRRCYQTYEGCARLVDGEPEQLVGRMKKIGVRDERDPVFVGRNLTIKNSMNTSIHVQYILPMQNSEYSSNNWKRNSALQDVSESMARNMLNDYEAMIQARRALNQSVPQGFAKMYELPYLEQSPVSEILEYLPVLCFFAFFVIVVNTTRGIVVEKSTFRPYLLSIGLPLHVYYIEKFIFSYFKCVIFVIPGAVFIAMVFESTAERITIFLSIILFLLPTISFSFLIGSMFKNQKTSFQCVLIVWNCLAIIPYRFKLETFEMNVRVVSWPTSLMFNYCFHFIVDSMRRSYDMGKFSLISSKHSKMAPILYYMVMLVVDAILMLGLAIFVDKYVKTLKIEWLFGKICRKKRKAPMSSNVFLETEKPHADVKNAKQGEKSRDNLESDIELEGLVKSYPGGETVVDNLNLTAIRGQVSVLLGQNGCGKSTTFAMIAGRTTPTSGSITICGIDAVENRSKARRLIGVCPEIRMLIDNLTVWEHLEIAHRLKRAQNDFKEDATQLMTTMQLMEKKKTLAKNLSGGMKRKLAMCMALIGDSKVVLLDEPTAGLDPCARYEVQNMLKNLKTDRTILLTTHDMDEAERLGDWIYMMEHGRIVASGSLQFLKSKFGGGILLTVVLENRDKEKEKAIKELLNICNVYNNSVRMKDTRGQLVEILLSGEDKNQLLAMMKTLEAISDRDFNSPTIEKLPEIQKEAAKKIQIISIGLSLNSLEQTFLSILSHCDVHKMEKKKKQREFASLIEEKNKPPAGQCFSTFRGLFWKRFYYAKRNTWQHIITYLLPILILAITNYAHLPEHFPGVLHYDIGLELLPKSKVIFQMSNESQNIVDFFEPCEELELIHHSNFATNIVDIYNEYDEPGDRISLVIKGGSNLVSKIYINSKVQMSKPLLVFLRNHFAQTVFQMDFSVDWVIQELAVDVHSHGKIYYTFWTKVCSIVMYFGVMLVEDRVSKFKHQQFLTEMSHCSYWLYHILWEFVLFLLDLLALTLIMYCFCISTFTIPFLVLMSVLFFFSMAPIFLTISLFVDAPVKMTISAVAIVYIATGVKVVLGQIVGQLSDANYKYLEAFRWMFPSLNFFSNLFKLWKWERPFDLSSELAVGFVHYKNEGESYPIWQDYIYLVPFMTLFSIIFLLLAKRRFRGIFTKKNAQKSSRICFLTKKCKAVQQEEQNVHTDTTTTDESIIVLEDLVKTYGNIKVVNGLCMTVRKGELFGLVGVNGCGKSAVVDILTCSTFPSGGTATIYGKSVRNWTKIGYCPQADALLPDFSGKELLYIIARLQNHKDIKEVFHHVIKCVGLTRQDAAKPVKNLSHGQRRKLSIGVAILSRAECLILDNPTAGLDAKSRREIWDLFEYLQEECGVSILLSTQSMSECEALCGRVAIMRRGEMIALGSTQELKSQYGTCFTLTIVLNNMNFRDNIVAEMQQQIPSSVLITETGLNLVWKIPRQSGEKWSTKIEEIREYLGDVRVKDLYLVQPTLSDTFIKLNFEGVVESERSET